MSLEPDVTRFLLSKAIVGDPTVKKAAARMVDRTAVLFLTHLDEILSEIVKGKNMTAEDVIKALKEGGYEHYVDIFKKGMEEEEEEEEEEPKKKSHDKDEGKEKKSKKKSEKK